MIRSICPAMVAAVLLISACKDPKPPMSGRLRGPADLAIFKGCTQKSPGCNKTIEGHHLLLLANSMSDDVRIFDVENRSFFKAVNPLFPFSIPVGKHPRSLAVDPYGDFAFVVNQLSEDVSLINLAPNRLVEVDTDGDPSTAAGSLDCPPEGANQRDHYGNDRCLAGVSRVPLGTEASLQPEQIAVPEGFRDDPEECWDRNTPLPAWVSLPASGQVAFLQFHYPGSGMPQRMFFIEALDLGGIPSGMDVTADGATLYVADEGSDSIAVVDTATRTVERVVVGGPSRRVFLTPDEQVLYVVRLDDNRIALVDTASRRRLAAFQPEDPRARDPEGDGLDIVVQGIPREITFVEGHTIDVLDDGLDEDSESTTHPPGETAVSLFAYVSDLDGNVYVLDAVNHGSIDVDPFDVDSLVNPVSIPGYVIRGKTRNTEEMLECFAALPNCEHPTIAEFDRTFGENNETDSTIYHGIRVHPGQTRTEGWILTWEGVLPGTGISTTGRFDGWRLVDDRLGLDFPASGTQPGDILEVVSPASEDCDENPTKFTVLTVDVNSLELEPVAGIDPDPGLCWPEAVRYNVRASQVWTVLGLESGPQERMRMIPWQETAPDPPVYDNGLIALTMFEPVDGEVPPDSAWGFTTDDGFIHKKFAPSVRAGLAGPLLAVDLEDGEEQDDDENGPAHDRVFLLFEGSNALMEFFPEALESNNYLLYQ